MPLRLSRRRTLIGTAAFAGHRRGEPGDDGQPDGCGNAVLWSVDLEPAAA